MVADRAFLVVVTTCPDTDSTEQIARALVARRVAASVNIVPEVRSVFRWRDAMQRAAEQLLLIKCVASNYNAVEAVIQELHPYEVPQVIALPIVEGADDYLAWIAESSVAPA